MKGLYQHEVRGIITKAQEDLSTLYALKRLAVFLKPLSHEGPRGF